MEARATTISGVSVVNADALLSLSIVKTRRLSNLKAFWDEAVVKFTAVQTVGFCDLWPVLSPRRLTEV